MITKFERREKKGFSSATFFVLLLLVLVLLLAGFLVVSNIKLKQRRARLDSQIAAIEKEIRELEKKNENLQEGISRLGEEEYIEKVAREELNLQKEGEQVIGFILPPEEKNEQEKWSPKKIGDWFKEKWEWLKSKL